MNIFSYADGKQKWPGTRREPGQWVGSPGWLREVTINKNKQIYLRKWNSNDLFTEPLQQLQPFYDVVKFSRLIFH